MKRTQNIFVTFLDLLKVKHTIDFSNKFFNEHPHKYNLFGLSKMLSDYGIENISTRISDKENDIFNIETPFIAHFGGDFAVVQKVEQDKVSFLWRNNDHVLPVPEFVNSWSGIILLAETSEKSVEPDYKSHRKKERLSLLKKTLLYSVCSLILLLIYINRTLYLNAGISMLLLLNLLGIYISWLLMLKQMRVQSQYADKICSLFKQKECNNVLGSKAAKLWGTFSWSEIGFGYFAANFLLLLLFPQTVYILALISIIALPYSFWSVWYQHTKARQWCVLCLIVLVLLWAIFIINCIFGYIRFPAFDFQELFYLFLIASCCFASILGVNAFIPLLNSDRAVPVLRQAINGLKADEGVFKALLIQQPYYETNDCDSIIRFGNPFSKLRLNILTNPYCNPCSIMHKRIEKLLQKTNNNISINYILSSFEESLNSTNKYLIAAWLNRGHPALDAGPPEQLLTEWFEKGKSIKDDFFKDMNLNIDDPEVEIEFQKHESWRKKSQLRATPTVLVNGYQLPESYKIEDLQYFTEFNVDIK